jgi:acyl-CoA thioesterase FadM
MRLFQRFTLETRIAAWSDTTAVMEQTFFIASGPQKGQMAARALVKAGFYDRKDRSFVTVKRLVAELGLPDQETESPPLTPEIEAFLKAETLLRPHVGD